MVTSRGDNNHRQWQPLSHHEAAAAEFGVREAERMVGSRCAETSRELKTGMWPLAGTAPGAPDP